MNRFEKFFDEELKQKQTSIQNNNIAKNKNKKDDYARNIWIIPGLFDSN